MLYCRKGNVVVSNHKFCFSLLLLGCGAAEEGGGGRREEEGGGGGWKRKGKKVKV